MELVGAALEGEAGDGLAGVAEFCGELGALEFEFAHGFDGWSAFVEVADLAHLACRETIDPELMLEGAAAVNADLIGGGEVVVAINADVALDAGGEVDEGGGGADAAELYEGEILDLSLGDGGGDFGGFHLEGADVFGDVDGF